MEPKQTVDLILETEATVAAVHKSGVELDFADNRVVVPVQPEKAKELVGLLGMRVSVRVSGSYEPNNIEAEARRIASERIAAMEKAAAEKGHKK